MTDNTRSGPPGPPWSVDVLADLHAGVLDAETSAQLWPRVNADPEARAVIEALDVIKVELGQLGQAPPEPMPAPFAARLDAAIEAEAARRAGVPRQPQPAAPVIDFSAARQRRNRRLAWGAGVLTAAAAAVAVTVVLFPRSDTTGGTPQAGAQPTLEVDGGNPSAAIGSVRNQRDYGPLENQQRLDECIKAAGLDPATAQTVGVRQVTVDGKPGIYVLLTAGRSNQFRLLIVEPTCGPGNPGIIANTVFPPG